MHDNVTGKTKQGRLNMDFKKIGLVILVLGIMISAYGGFQFTTNQPKKFNSAESKQTVFGGRDDFRNMMNVNETNRIRSGKREDATKTMIVGGIVAFIGVGLSLSAKKREPKA